MKSISVNLMVRFLLEILALITFGMWGWRLFSGVVGLAFSIMLPLVMAVIWGVFAVPNDPSRSGKAPIVVSGLVRLVIELALFALSVLLLFDMDYTNFGFIYGLTIIAHYIISYNRVKWLLKQK